MGALVRYIPRLPWYKAARALSILKSAGVAAAVAYVAGELGLYVADIVAGDDPETEAAFTQALERRERPRRRRRRLLAASDKRAINFITANFEGEIKNMMLAQILSRCGR